ncbi:MAG TPA: acetyl-CoA carboxylase, biotin carboxyl carrier protein [Rhodobacteraceae bacterium]|nr:acetyl-CoA carboxylase, biotin carboxyl carrier protein [Paracoccaceae bacterium]
MKKTNHDSDVAFIKALAELLNENNLTELQVKRDYGEDDSLNVQISRQVIQQITAPVATASVPVAAAELVPAPQEPAHSSAGTDPASDPGAVTSPMVGTVYLQGEPDTPAFISVGQKVEEGETLLIVEAMKTMNHIPSPRAGTVKRIVVDNGAAVEFGAPLVILE